MQSETHCLQQWLGLSGAAMGSRSTPRPSPAARVLGSKLCCTPPASAPPTAPHVHLSEEVAVACSLVDRFRPGPSHFNDHNRRLLRKRHTSRMVAGFCRPSLGVVSPPVLCWSKGAQMHFERSDVYACHAFPCIRTVGRTDRMCEPLSYSRSRTGRVDALYSCCIECRRRTCRLAREFFVAM
jgi:hypothetical protein